MLKRTFIHIPRIGPVTERRLWAEGIVDWNDCLGDKAEHIWRSSLSSKLKHYVEESFIRLEQGDAAYFERNLPSSETWRLYDEFKDTVAFVDIETTGFLGMGEITLIGVYDGTTERAFVKGYDLEDFMDYIREYRLLVTYNGKQFDLPFIRGTFGSVPECQAHIDLRYPLRRLGYWGGLKAIEVHLGLAREGPLGQLDGQCAVWLWELYERGNESAVNVKRKVTHCDGLKDAHPH